MRIIKWLLIVIVAIVVLLVGAAVVISQKVDPNDYKAEISAAAKKATGRDLAIEGDLQLNFFPWVGVNTGRVTLANAAGFSAEPMLAFDAANVKVKVLPLLTKSLEIADIELDSPVIRLATSSTGVNNWDDLTGANQTADSASDTTASTAEQSSSSDTTSSESNASSTTTTATTTDPSSSASDAGAFALKDITVGGLLIKDARVEYTNDQTAQTVNINDLQIKSGRFSLGDMTPLTISLQATGSDLPDTAIVALDSQFKIGNAIQSLSLADTTLDVSMGDMAAKLQFDNLKSALQSGISQVAGLRLSANQSELKADLTAPEIKLNLNAEELLIPEFRLDQAGMNLQGALRGTKITSDPTINSTLQLSVSSLTQWLQELGVQADLPKEFGGGLTLNTLALYGGDQVELDELSLNLAPLSLSGNAKVGSIAQLTAGKDLAAQLASVSADLALSGKNIPLRQWLNDFNVEHGLPGSLLGDTDISGGVVINNNNLAVNKLALDVNGKTLNADAKISDLGAVVGGKDPLNYISSNGSLKLLALPLGDILTHFKVDSGLPADMLKDGDLTTGFNLSNGNLALQDLSVKLAEQSLKSNLQIANLGKLGTEGSDPITALSGSGQLAINDFPLAQTLSNLAIDSGLPAGWLEDLSLNSGFDLQKGRLSLQKLDLAVDKQQIKSDLTISDLSKLIAGGGDNPLALLSGNGSIDINDLDLQALLDAFKVDTGLRKSLLANLQLDSAFKFANGGVSLSKLKAEADDLTLSGSLGLNDLASPTYKFDLAVNAVDLDTLFAENTAEPTTAGGSSASTSSTSAAKDSPAAAVLLPVEPLQGLKLDGKLALAEFKSGPLKAQNIKLKVVGDGSSVALSPLSMNTFEGKLTTNLRYSIKGGTPAITMDTNLSNANVGLFLSEMDVFDNLDGTGNVSINMKGKGLDVDALLSSMDGLAKFELADGAISGYDLQQTILDLQALTGKKLVSEESGLSLDKKTKFAAFTGSFDIKKGVLSSNDINLKAPILRVGGGGKISLPGQSLDMDLEVAVVKSIKGQGGENLNKLDGITIPLSIKGPFADPKIRPDVTAIATTLAKRELQKELKKKLGVSAVTVDENGNELTVEDSVKATLKDKLKDSLTKSVNKELGLSSGVTEGATGQAGGQQAAPQEPASLEDQVKKAAKDSLFKALGF